jgi:hypothetical protein
VKAEAVGLFTVRLALPVAVLPAALEAVTVQVAVPAEEVPTLMLPLVPEPVAVAPAPEQLTEADVALPVVQLKVEAEPAFTDVGLKPAPVTEGAATTLKLAPPVAVDPAALLAVTVQVAVPAEEVPTLMLPLVPEPVAVAPAPEQDTEAEDAPDVCQAKVLALPAVTVVGLKKVYPAPCT